MVARPRTLGAISTTTFLCSYRNTRVSGFVARAKIGCSILAMPSLGMASRTSQMNRSWFACLCGRSATLAPALFSSISSYIECTRFVPHRSDEPRQLPDVGCRPRLCQRRGPQGITIEREKGTLQTYDPRRLSGVAVHREVEHEFSLGDRIQFTAPSKELKVANRELGTIERVRDRVLPA